MNKLILSEQGAILAFTIAAAHLFKELCLGTIGNGGRFKANSPVATEFWTVDTAKHAAVM